VPGFHLAGKLNGLIDLRQDGAGFVMKDTTSLGQDDTTPLAPEQMHPHFGLQHFDLLGQGRLGNSQALRRSADMHFLSSSAKISQMTKFHIDM
jgi:hypothetical protein